MPFIPHGLYLPDQRTFYLWGESDEPAKAKRGRKKAQPPHGFAAPVMQLADWALRQAEQIVPEADSVLLRLPGDGGQPAPSPELVQTGARPAIAPDALTLSPWAVDGLRLSIMDAVDLLVALDADSTLGADLRFWRGVALYALSLVVGQQVIPALARDGFKLRAFWQPDPEAPEALAALARRMPPACRAATDDPERAPEPRMLVDQFVGAVVDAVIREASPPAASKPRTPGGHWLAALTGKKPELGLSGAEAEGLFQAWQTWAGQAQVAGNAAFRIAFRLDAPRDDEKPWELHYLLQATDDPSLIVDAGQLWRGRGNAYLTDRFDQPQERLLKGLGFAGRLFPPIMNTLRSTAPQMALLETSEAYTFLKETAPLLQSAGFRVLLPRWWGGKNARLSARAKVKSGKAPLKSHLSLDSLLHYEYEVMLGGQAISVAELERLALLKQPLVLLRGQWVALDPNQLQTALKIFERPQGEIALSEALRLGLDADAPADGAAIESAKIDGWLKKLLDTLKQPDKIEELPPPPGLHGELRPYQQRGYSWLVFLLRHGLGACLADDMGLGKTLTAITLLLHQRNTVGVDAPALVICPTSVVGNWRRELRRFAPDLNVYTHQGPDRVTGDDFQQALRPKDAPIDVVISSYPLLARDRETLGAIPWSTLVLDEAQNIKNPDTKQAQAARALNAGQRLALTGTPVENRLSELWSIFQFLNPGYLGSERNFRRQFASPIERLNDKAAAKRLKALAGPFILRRLKSDPKIINDLPEKLEMKVYCNLTAEQGTLYAAAVKEALRRIEGAEDEGDGMGRRGLVLSMLMQLKQICNHPAQYLKDGESGVERSGKLARLVEMLEECYASDDRVLVFTQFAEMGELLRTRLRDTFYDEPLWLHGGTPVKEREAMIARFQATHGPRVFILSLKAGGVGLNLTQANHVFHFDRWWNPAVENQATDRAFRIGQKRNVQVHKFVCAGTLEEKIDEMIDSKKALADSVVGADESWLTEMNTDQLRELVQLREAGD